MVDQVSNTTKLTWDEVFEMNIIKFLNINCYLRDKAEWERQQQEKWKRKH